MEQEIEETLIYFRKNISDLRKLGKDWGLNESEIEECIQQAMSVDLKKVQEENIKSIHIKCIARKTWSKLCCIFKIMAILSLLLVIVGITAQQNDEVFSHVIKVFASLDYPIMRSLRLMALPLHNYFNMEDFYNEDCVIPNPWQHTAVHDAEFCRNCKNIRTVAEYVYSVDQNGTELELLLPIPVIFKNHSNLVSLKDIQTTLVESFVPPSIKNTITTNLEWVVNLTDLLDDDVERKLVQKPDFYFTWVSKSVSTSQLVRKIFPRPDFLAEDYAIGLLKAVFLSGPESSSYLLPSDPVANLKWYVQGWGSRQVILYPARQCHTLCQTLEVTLGAGDVLAYYPSLHDVEMHALGKDISIGFLGQALNSYE